MKIAILTFDGFNEIDSFVAYNILNRMKKQQWKAYITSPTPTVTSLNGVAISSERPLEFVQEADAVLVGSGTGSLAVSEDPSIIGRLSLNPAKQLIGSQCSGALILARLGVLQNIPACVDVTSRAAVERSGVRVLEQSFYASGNIASAGGCLASTYLAAWVLLRLGGIEAVCYAVGYVAPVGEEESFVAQVLQRVEPDSRQLKCTFKKFI